MGPDVQFAASSGVSWQVAAAPGGLRPRLDEQALLDLGEDPRSASLLSFRRVLLPQVCERPAARRQPW